MLDANKREVLLELLLLPVKRADWIDQDHAKIGPAQHKQITGASYADAVLYISKTFIPGFS